MRAGTIVASNYSAMAQVLGDSFLEHHPDSTFTVLVVDDLDCDFGEHIDVARLSDLDLGPDALAVMKTIYDVMELSTAVKPSFLRWLLGADGGSVACYLDPDIEVFSNFDDAVAPAADHGVVLTPHVLAPVPRDGLKVNEGTIMQAGMYNCGFLAVSERGRPFLDWWDERLRFDAVVDFEQSHFTDQRWVDWVPSLFDYTICRDPGMNIAWWNIHDRPIDIDDGGPTTAGQAVRFVHFSGYDPTQPDLLSKHQLPCPRVEHAPGSGMRALADAYGQRLVGLGHLERRHAPYAWDTSVDGVELTHDVRRRVRSAVLHELARGATLGNRHTPDGFGGGELTLGAWLSEDADERTTHVGVARSSETSGDVAVRSRDVLRRVRAYGERMGRHLGDRYNDATRSRRSAVGTDAGVRPFAFLHVPKSAGSSLVASLRNALGEHAWSPYGFDPAWMGPYRDTARPESVREQVLEDRDELLAYDAVAGHFTLATLLTRFAISDVATVVREPRCRLLSHYEYWRGLSDAERDAELPWESSRSATQLDFADWLEDESIAYQSDNTLIRQLVDDPAIPDNQFIPNDQLARLARLAATRIRRLGFVGVVEQGDAMFEQLGDFVGTPLEQRRLNVTDRQSVIDVTALFDRAVPALAARTAGDALVWRAAAQRAGIADPDVVAEAAWMRRVGATVHNRVASDG